jgi:regulator of sirC expression with transglutaminase-like and TPR domain
MALLVTPTAAPIAASAATHHPQTLAELMALPPASLEQCDIARMNLLCAEGLGPASSLDEALQRLDLMAGRVKQETERNHHRFKEEPDFFDRSEAVYRMMMLAVVLKEDCGIRYNPARITEVGDFEPNATFFADARDVFLGGLLDDRRMGTCSSLPVFQVAVGRRLGYPLRLVATKNHLFVRWDAPDERFNVDATGDGFHKYDDAHYRQWPFPVTPQEEQDYGYLRSMTPAEELSVFLGLRGHCLMTQGKPAEALASHEAAAKVVPESKTAQRMLEMARQDAAAHTQLPMFRSTDPAIQAQLMLGTDPQSLEGEMAAERAIQSSRQRR